MSGRKVSTLLVALVSGLLFGAGLAISGMIDPAKVLGFLDVAGDWDPSLAFVMAGAIAVYSPVALWARRGRRSWFGGMVPHPKSSGIDGRLLVGAVLFGLGWGLVGLCPGPALASLSVAAADTWIFVVALVVGVVLHKVVGPRLGGRKPRSSGA